MTQESSRTYNPLWRRSLSPSFFLTAKPRGADKQASSLSSILSSQPVWAQCHIEDALCFLPLGHVFPFFIFSPCSSPWKRGSQSQASLEMTSPYCHTTSAKRSLESTGRLLIGPTAGSLLMPCSKIRSIWCGQSSWNSTSWPPARPSSL